MGFRRADLAEPPPEGWAALGLNPLYTEKRFGSMDELRAYCAANHVSANNAYNNRRFMACTIPSKREVVLPAKGLLRDPVREQAIEEHEEGGHSWGLVHHDGHGWFYPDGRRAEPLTPGSAQMMRSMFEAQARQESVLPAPTQTGSVLTPPNR